MEEFFIIIVNCDDYNRVHWVTMRLSMSQQKKKKIARESGEKVYYQYYAIMGTRVRVVAGYRAFSAFILLRRGKALGVFFLFFVSLSLSFFWKKFRVAQISRQSPTWKKVLHIRKWTPGEMRSDEIRRTYLWWQNTSECPTAVVSTCMKNKKKGFKNT